MKTKIKEAKENAGSTALEKEIKLEVSGVKFFAGVTAGDPNDLKTMGDDLINRGEYQLVCLAGKDDKSVKAFVWSSDSLNNKVKAGDALKNILEVIGGRGGGKPQFAQGGSPEVEKLSNLVSYLEEDFKAWLSEKL